MKVRLIGKSDPFMLINGKEYEKVGESHGYWRVVDETGEDYLYDPKVFEVVEEDKEKMNREESLHKNSAIMKAKYIGKSDELYCINGKVYDVIGETHGMWKVVDESGEDYLYSPEMFELVDESESNRA